jgi:hypothetical protein
MIKKLSFLAFMLTAGIARADAPNIQQFLNDAWAEKDAQLAAVQQQLTVVQQEFAAYKQMIMDKFGPLGLTDWEKQTYRGYDLDYTGYHETFRSDFDDLTQISGPTGAGPWYSNVHSGFGAAGFVPIGGTNDPYSIVNGALNIRVQKVGTNWYGGIIQTMKADGTGFAQELGNGSIFEARIKVPPSLATLVPPPPAPLMHTPGAPQHGEWGAFWLLSAADFHPEITDHQIEIDPLEFYGDDKGIHTTVHIKPRRVPQPGDYPTRVSDSLYSDPQTVRNTVGGAQTYPVTTTLGDGQFHLYTWKMEPDFMTMYFDGKAIGRYVTLPEFKTSLYMLINNTLYGDKVSSIVSPLDMQIDYVRAMKKD